MRQSYAAALACLTCCVHCRHPLSLKLHVCLCQLLHEHSTSSGHPVPQPISRNHRQLMLWFLASRALRQARQGAEVLHLQSAAEIDAWPEEVTVRNVEQVASDMSAQQPLLLDNTPRSKTVSKLAALQMSSPGCTPSPMPLRRRLQQQSLTATIAPTDTTVGGEAPDEVICIDC